MESEYYSFCVIVFKIPQIEPRYYIYCIYYIVFLISNILLETSNTMVLFELF